MNCLRLSVECGLDSTNVVGGRIANTDYIFLTLTSLENNDTAVDLYCNRVSLVGKRRFSVPIHSCSHLKKQSSDLDVVGRVQNDTCQASEKMQ